VAAVSKGLGGSGGKGGGMVATKARSVQTERLISAKVTALGAKKRLQHSMTRSGFKRRERKNLGVRGEGQRLDKKKMQ